MPEVPPLRKQIDPQGRRASPRIHVDGHVLARLMTLNAPVEMRDVSFGGFQLASAVPVQVGELHEVRAVTAAGQVCMLHARVVRCTSPTTSEPLYISGWKVAQDRDSIGALAAIVDSLTARLQFNVDTD